jgi:hypothetical protein
MSKKNDNNRTHSRVASAAERPAQPTEASAALQRLLPEINNYPEAKIRRATFDVPRGVSITAAAQPRLVTLRERFVVETPTMPIRYVDDLKVYAMAAWYAHLTAMPKPDSPLDTLKAEAATLKTDMAVGAAPLAHKGFFNKETVAKINEGQGALDLANDLVAYAALYTEAWPQIADKTTVEWAQVERAALLGPQLILALGEKVAFGGTPTEAARLRARAVSLFLDVYEEIQRAVEYIRWHEGDAAAYAPTLYRGGGRRPTAESPSGQDTEATGEGDAPTAPTSGGPTPPVG